jgi:hypothetical protein
MNDDATKVRSDHLELAVMQPARRPRSGRPARAIERGQEPG